LTDALDRVPLVALVKRLRCISATLRKRHRRARRVVASGGSAGGGGFFVQYYVGHYHGPNLTLASFGLLALILCVGALGVELLGLLVPRCKRAIRARRHERRRRLAAANVERRTRALMSELCPQGWRAQITLLGPGDEVPPGLCDGEPVRVALDWAELEDESGRPAVIRRVWAPTIAEALEAMLADRRTDETLEQIERGAAADGGAPWPDIYL
jgi:hypothetical protein